MPLHACIHRHINVLVCVFCAWQARATICCLLIRSHHLISIWIDSCNADSFHPCHCWKQPITAGTVLQHADGCLCVCVCVIHSLQTLTADSVIHPVFLTHLEQNCNLVHWTFKLLDVTWNRMGEEKHDTRLIVTSLTSVKPVFASQTPFHSPYYFLLMIFLNDFFFYLNGYVLLFNLRLDGNFCTMLLRRK